MASGTRPVRRVIAALALAAAGAGCSGDSGDHEASRAAVEALRDGSSDLADAVAVVAEEGVDDETARLLASMMPDHFDALADAAVEAAEGGDDAMPRPQLVDFFEAITNDDAARQVTRRSFATWITGRVEGALDGTRDGGAITGSLHGIDLVLAASLDGVDEAGEPPEDFEGWVLIVATERVAKLVADHDRLPMPSGGEMAAMLDDAFPATGSPLDLLDVGVTQSADAYEADDNWR